MRGKAIQGHPLPLECGITPAYAGKSVRIAPVFITHRDHPRVCGEKRGRDGLALLRTGSPPRMRGKELGFHIVAVKIGITPAYAGKRRCPRFRPGKTRDHPRVCGEKGKNHPRKPYCEGSPPRVRGKGSPTYTRKGARGITPAYAGKSSHQHGAGRWRRDHPRVCGEKPFLFYGGSSDSGSPPHGRGKVTHL